MKQPLRYTEQLARLERRRKIKHILTDTALVVLTASLWIALAYLATAELFGG
jgi:hypothetical protein